jgi:hypothetical protein
MTDFDDNHSGSDGTRETTIRIEQKNPTPSETSLGHKSEEDSTKDKELGNRSKKEETDSESGMGSSEREQKDTAPNDVNIRWKNWYHNKGGKQRIAEQRSRKRNHDKLNKQEIDNFKMQNLVKQEWKTKNLKLKTKKDKWKTRFRQLKQQFKETPQQNPDNQILDGWGKPVYF